MADSQRGEESGAPATDYTAVTIPVHVSVRARETVLCQPEAEDLLRRSRTLALQPCECRQKSGNCDAPRDVCLTLDGAAEEAVARGTAHVVELPEALAALERSHRAGLVHFAFRKPGEAVGLLCSCCPCCCWFFAKLKGFDYHHAVAESTFVASFDDEACAGCLTCVGRCPFGAWEAGEPVPGKVALAADRCFGCGLCASTCPTGAIALVPRKDQQG